MSDYVKTNWVEGGAPGISAAQLNRMEDGIDTAHSELAAHQAAATLDHPDASVTDAKVGNRTINQALAGAANTGLLTSLLSWLAGAIKAVKGTANWYDAPATTLASAAAHAARTDNPHGVTAAQIGAGLPISYQVFTASANWVAPAGVSKVLAEVVGGGGNGGSAAASSYTLQAGDGGGGGGYAKKLIVVTPGETLTLTVGAAGGTSSVKRGTTVLVQATGGSGVTPGSGSNGDVNISGQYGDAGIGMGGSQDDTDFVHAGAGGDSVLGHGGASHKTRGGAYAGGNYGGGGSGAINNWNIGANGGTGAPGVVILRW